MKPFTKALLIVALLAALAPLAFRASAQDEQPPLAPERFKDKVAVFYVTGSMEGSIMMREAKFERVHDRWFVTGVSADTGIDDWTRDADAGVDWDRVESYYLFTEEQFKDQVYEGANAVGLGI